MCYYSSVVLVCFIIFVVVYFLAYLLLTAIQLISIRQFAFIPNISLHTVCSFSNQRDQCSRSLRVQLTDRRFGRRTA